MSKYVRHKVCAARNLQEGLGDKVVAPGHVSLPPLGLDPAVAPYDGAQQAQLPRLGVHHLYFVTCIMVGYKALVFSNDKVGV